MARNTNTSCMLLFSLILFLTLVNKVHAIDDPVDFAVSLYGSRLASQNAETPIQQSLNLASAFFAKDLNKAFAKVINADGVKTGELACLDFDAFTNAQDTMRGFFIENATSQGAITIVPVNLGVQSLDELKTPSLYLHLIKTPTGLLVNDIDYGKEQGTLRSRLKSCLNHKHSSF